MVTHVPSDVRRGGRERDLMVVEGSSSSSGQ